MFHPLSLSTFIFITLLLPLIIECQPGGKDGGSNTILSTLCDKDGASSTYNEYIDGDLRMITASGCANVCLFISVNRHLLITNFLNNNNYISMMQPASVKMNVLMMKQKQSFKIRI